MEKQGRTQAFVCLFRDVTQKKIAEEKLRQSHQNLEERVAERTKELEQTNQKLQLEAAERSKMEKKQADLFLKSCTQSKLASLGEIATGVAHEINQPLSFIKIIFEATLKDLKDGRLELEELKEDSRESLKQISRITSIINHLRTFGRSDDAAMINYVNMREVINNTFILMGQRLRLQNVRHTINIDPDLPQLLGSSVRIEQVLINLLQNSADALKECKDPKIQIDISRQDDNIQIIFTDNGKGIPAEISENIFDPFFTTKEVGKGTGLGLSVTYGIIKDHNGSIELTSSTPGQTSFLITLPTGVISPQIAY